MRGSIVSLNFTKYINLQVGIIIENTLTNYKAIKKTYKTKFLMNEQQKNKLITCLGLV
jgi:hypothetical protein